MNHDQPARPRLARAAPGTPLTDIQPQLRAASIASGRTIDDIEREMHELRCSPGGLTADDYFKHALHDTSNITGAKSAFAGERVTRSIWGLANHSEHWFGPMMDKVAFGALLTGFGLPTIQLIAVFGEGPRVRDCRFLPDRNALAAFLSKPDAYPLFGKPRISERSYGAVSLTAFDALRRRVDLLDERSIGVDEIAWEIARDYVDGYLFQKRLVPCLQVREMCGPRPATVRVYTLNGKHGPEVFRVVWKIPAGPNMADNFWRTGNLLAAVDRRSGRVTRAISGCWPDRVQHECHPDSQTRLIGMMVPMLPEIEALAMAAANVFADIGLIGWDIAATADGPVIVEGNFAPDFSLVQMAEGRGVLDDQLDEFLQWCRSRKAALTSKLHAAAPLGQRGGGSAFEKPAGPQVTAAALNWGVQL